MWSENMDNKIRAAAGNSLHGPDENAWNNMEALLDKHLPQKKKRRGILFFLLLALLTGIPGFFLVKKLSSGTHTTTSSYQKTTDQATGRNHATTAPAPSSTATGTDKPALPTPVIIQGGNATGSLLRSRPATVNNNATIRVRNSSSAGKTAIEKTGKPGNTNNGTVQAPYRQPTAISTEALHEKQEAPPVSDTLSVSKKTFSDTTVVPPAKQAADHPVLPKQRPQRSPGRISLSLSAGPDISSVGLQPGKWRVQYGIGIGYNITKRLTLRTGFYTARKIYAADSNSYHSGFNSINNYYKLDKVDANCLVYEIPVLLTYHFSRKGNHNWFASAGLSSLLMKKEDYTASYTTAFGQVQQFDYSFSNENSHWFSVLNFSSGYQYHFSNRLALMMEPYIKIPLSGIGFGKVKLNSGGLLFSVRYTPF